MTKPAEPGASRPASFAADEAGSVRTDRIVLGLAAIALLAVLFISDMNSDDPTFGGAADAATAATDGGAGAEAPTRTISAVGRRAPEPEPVDGRQSYASHGYEDRFEPIPDNERLRLDAEADVVRAADAAAAEALRAAEAAAGDPPPLAEEVDVADEAAPETAATAETTDADGS